MQTDSWQPEVEPIKKVDKRGIIIIAAAVVIILAGIFAWRFFNKQKKTVDTAIATPTPVELNANLSTAKNILNFLWTQKNDLGFYAITSICETAENATTCQPADNTWRNSLPVMWARFKYYQTTGDEEELTRLRSDIEQMIRQVINSPERELQVNKFNCALMKEIAASEIVDAQTRDQAAQICFDSLDEEEGLGISLTAAEQAAIDAIDLTANDEEAENQIIAKENQELLAQLVSRQLVASSSSIISDSNSNLTIDLYNNLDQINKLDFDQINIYTTAADVRNASNYLINSILKTVLEAETVSPIQLCLLQQGAKQYLSYNPNYAINLPATFTTPLAEVTELTTEDTLLCAFAHYLNQDLNLELLLPTLRADAQDSGFIFTDRNHTNANTYTNALAAGLLTQ
ncbi:MAG: hypothetical protein Q4G02_01390 [bacterium]|nr:hypothetical protein [bacterium]